MNRNIVSPLTEPVEGRPTEGDGWDRLIEELLRIRTLEDDWDGQGAEAPSPALVDGAIALAQQLRRTTDASNCYVVPGVNGTVSFEWYSPDRYVEIEVTGPNEAERSVIPKGAGIADQDILRW